MNAPTLTWEFDVERYNALGSVEDADEIVRRDNAIGEFMADAAFLFVTHQVQHRFGVSLLHRHHPCQEGERFIQRAEVIDGEPALVTRPTAGTVDFAAAVPWVWAEANGKFIPMEFTCDPLARQLLLQDDFPPDFLRAFAALTATSPVGHLFGLAVVERRFYAQVSSDQIPTEYSDLAARSSSVFIERRTSTTRLIETAWTFEGRVDPVLGCVVSIHRVLWPWFSRLRGVAVARAFP